MKNNSVIIKTAFEEFTFAAENGGFPARLAIKESDGNTVELWNVQQPFLTICTSDGSLLKPTLSGAFSPHKYRSGSAQILEFPKILWINVDTGEEQEDLSLSLKWEFYDEGTTFCDMFLFYSTLEVPELWNCKLAVPLDFSDFSDLHWSTSHYMPSVNAAFIQTTPPERFIPGNESRMFADKLLANTGFYARREYAPSLYCELFLEGNNTLFNRSDSASCSSVSTRGKQKTVEWNFQKNKQSNYGRPLHWRNRWGLTCRPAQTRRTLPPLPMYHYIDNFQRFPTKSEVKAIAESGAKLVILHDCWRIDTQNNGIPYNEKKFRYTIDEFHKHGIRIALYVRGNELSVREDAASWFDHWLQKDFDGIYSDYGSPYGYCQTADENFPGGRIAFREYFLAFKALRERVGEKGILYVHSGPLFSAIAAGFYSSYVSGEGERGILIRGRSEHEYFAMASICPGTIWTAAFPEYNSDKMATFMATAGEVPHLPLGKQIASTSLEHPPVPGISDRNFAQLHYCYTLLGNGYGFDFFSDYNCRGVFIEEKQEIAHSLFLVPSKKYGIMFISNCSDTVIKTSFKLNGEQFKRYKFFQIPGTSDPKTPIILEPWQFICALVAFDNVTAKKVLSSHPPLKGELATSGKKYLQVVDKQRKLREKPEKCNKCTIEVKMPSRITSHEQSLWDDLYNVNIYLREVKPNHEICVLGAISLNGLEEKIPDQKNRLRPGTISKEIALEKLLPPGRHTLELYSEHQGEAFYSFVSVRIMFDDIKSDEIFFRNEVETDRAIIHWNVDLI